MIGCADSDSQAGRIKDIVSMMGPPNKTFLCGQLGNGNAAKISNNYLSGTFLVAIAEAMAIGIRSGVDKNVLADVIRSSSGFSWTGEHLQPVPGINPDAPSSNGYKASFPHELIIKDVGLGVDAGNKIDIAQKKGDTALDAYRKASDDPRCKVEHPSAVKVSKLMCRRGRTFPRYTFTSQMAMWMGNELRWIIRRSRVRGRAQCQLHPHMQLNAEDSECSVDQGPCSIVSQCERCDMPLIAEDRACEC